MSITEIPFAFSIYVVFWWVCDCV